MATNELAGQRRTGVDIEGQPALAGERPKNHFRVALSQIAPRLGDVTFNLEKHVRQIETARRDDADLIVFPELSLTGYFLKDLVPEVALRTDSPQIAELARLSAGIDIVVGAVIESDDFRFYNAALFFSRERLHFVHRKVYLPTYGLFDKSRYLAAGDTVRAFSMPFAGAAQRDFRGGMMICEDMWHPSVASILARDGVEFFVCLSASPGRGVGKGTALGTANSYDAMTRTYAQLYTSYVLYCNRVGYEDGVGFWGGSRIVGPDGDVVAGPAGRKEELVMATLDTGAIRRQRIANPLLRDERHNVNDAENERLRVRRPRD